jgi:hypothetical protein
VTHSQRNEAIKLAIKAYSQRALLNRETARKSLIASGIYTASGELQPQYGGPAIKRKA